MGLFKSQAEKVADAERAAVKAGKEHGPSSTEAKRARAVADQARHNASDSDLREADGMRYEDRLRPEYRRGR